MSAPEMQLFATLVEVGTLSGAARELGISKSGASKRLAALETRLGVKLLYRSSRAVRATEAGLVYYQGCRRVLEQVAETESETRRLGAALVGRLRVAGPHFLGQDWLSPALLEFVQKNPGLRGDLMLDDQYSNLIEEGVDVAIRVSAFPDSSLVVRRLARVDRVMCAAPSYLEQASEITSWRDLEAQRWIVYSHRLEGDDQLKLLTKEGPVQLRMSGQVRTNSGFTIRQALLRGLGLCVLPRMVVNDVLQTGELQCVLPELEFETMWLAAVFPHTRKVAAKVRSFVDFLQKEWPPPSALAASWTTQGFTKPVSSE